MKFRLTILMLAASLLSTACNFSLAADITPPPDYVSPTPPPTLGPLYPARAPDTENGAAIYEKECLPCHGERGMGDGPQGKQLPVTVAALGLPETARPASPAQWFTTVSQGNLDRFMPPFVSLSDQERWDVVSYALTLHTTVDEIAQGKSLYEANCVNCHTGADNLLTNQVKMAALSAADIVRTTRQGSGDMPALTDKLSEDEAWAVADYVRTLTFASALPTATPEAATVTPATVEAGTGTPEAVGGTGSTPEAARAPGLGTVNGTIGLASGGALPAGLTVTLRGYDHGQDQSSGPQEVLTLTGTAAPNGSFTFQNVEMPEGRIFLAQVEYQGIKYQTDFGVTEAGSSQINLPPVKLYEPSGDFNALQLTQVHIYSDFASEGTAQFLEIYTFANPSDKAVVIPTDGTDIPFIKMPQGSQNLGFEVGQESAPFVPATGGIAIVPSAQSYSLIAFFSLPYEKELKVEQPFALAAPSVLVLIPDGMKVKGDRLTDHGIQPIQNINFQSFTASDLKAGETLTFTVSGRPKTTPSATSADSTRRNVLIGVGAFGLVLILAGVWLFIRDRNRAEEEDSQEEDEFETSEEVMDAILALDDLHRAGKLSDEAYKKRRAELKEKLKDFVA